MSAAPWSFSTVVVSVSKSGNVVDVVSVPIVEIVEVVVVAIDDVVISSVDVVVVGCQVE